MDTKRARREYDIQNAISSSVRTERPGNYLFKIGSFSLLVQALTKTKCEKYDSCHFEAGGCKWKLSIYPNGDKKRGGDGHISLFLALADPNSLPPGSDVRVVFKFFVFDHHNDSYLVLQDGGKEKRFHALKTEWGFAKLLSLQLFNDPSKGYLVDDCCAFGVEMFIQKCEFKGESLSIVKEPANGTFIWKIEKFSTFTKDFYESAMFAIGGLKWRLQLYPQGDSRAKGKSLSLFLSVCDYSALPCGWKIFAEYKPSIKDQINGKDCESTTACNWFDAISPSWGWSEFMLLSSLNNFSNGFVVRDTLIVEVRIISTTDVSNLS